MELKTISLNCPGCGAPVSTSIKDCSFCGRPVIISSFNSVEQMSILELKKYSSEYSNILKDQKSSKISFSAGICNLKLKLYDNAIENFEQAVQANIDNVDGYFYLAISLLKGKKAFLQDREVIDKVLEYLNAIIEISQQGLYYYFRAYIKYDYFQRKFYRIEPNYKEDLEKAKVLSISEIDKKTLFEMLSVDMPMQLS